MKCYMYMFVYGFRGHHIFYKEIKKRARTRYNGALRVIYKDDNYVPPDLDLTRETINTITCGIMSIYLGVM